MRFTSGEKQEGTPLKEILLDSYNGDKDAVDAAIYFIGMYEQWAEIANSLDDETRIVLDRSVCQILNGEGGTITASINELGEKILTRSNALEFYKLITALLSGEIVTNPFVMDNRERIGAAVALDAMNEVSRRMLKGAGLKGAESGKWSIVSAIAQITSGADVALRLNINLKSEFADDN